MLMRTSHKLKMQEHIESMSLTFLVGDFQPRNVMKYLHCN